MKSCCSSLVKSPSLSAPYAKSFSSLASRSASMVQVSRSLWWRSFSVLFLTKSGREIVDFKKIASLSLARRFLKHSWHPVSLDDCHRRWSISCSNFISWQPHLTRREMMAWWFPVILDLQNPWPWLRPCWWHPKEDWRAKTRIVDVAC